MIPLVRPVFPSQEKISHYFSKSLETGAISNFGPCFSELVRRLNSINSRHNLPCATGTAAIQLAIQTKFPRGSRILMPDYTHVGTLQAVVAAGCEPILIPVSKATWTVNEAFIHCVPHDEFDGFIVVSPFGYRVNFEGFDHIAESIGKPVIYDLAGAWGMAIDTKAPVCFSLHGTKNFSCGEGGIVSFSEEPSFALAMRLSNFDTLSDRSVASSYANNLKPDELKCAVVLAHLDEHQRVISRISKKRALIDFYQESFGDLCIQHDLHHGNAAPSLCVLSGLKAERMEKIAMEYGLVLKQYYPLLTQMPGLQSIKRFGTSSSYFKTCLALPSDVDQEEAEKVVSIVLQINRVLSAAVYRR